MQEPPEVCNRTCRHGTSNSLSDSVVVMYCRFGFTTDNATQAPVRGIERTASADLSCVAAAGRVSQPTQIYFPELKSCLPHVGAVRTVLQVTTRLS